MAIYIILFFCMQLPPSPHAQATIQSSAQFKKIFNPTPQPTQQTLHRPLNGNL
jgi:hypothetical protein